MKRKLLGAVSLAALLASTGSGWSLTAAETWDHWKTQIASLGLTLSAESETAGDGGLTLQGLRYAFSVEDVAVTLRTGDVTLTDQSDGTVLATFPETSTMALDVSGPDGAFAATLDFAHPDARSVISMDGNTLVEQTTMPQLDVTLGQVTLDGAPVDGMEIAAAYSLIGLDYTLRSQTSGAMVFGTDSTLESIEGGYSFSMPSEGISMKNETRGNGMSSRAELTLGSLVEELQGDLESMDEEAGMELIGRVLASGFSVEGISHYATHMVIDESTNPESGATRSEITSHNGTAEIKLDAQGLAYAVSAAGGFDATVAFGDLPLPEMQIAGSSADTALSLPFTSGSVPSDAALRFAVEGLTVSESLWAMVDPAGVLPRDPATLVIDLAAKVRWLSDLFSAETFAAMEPPIQPLALEIEDLRLSVLGADLTGTGGFTFDNTDMETFDGMPRPEGSAKFVLTGGNALLEKLTQVGLVPEEQVMMVRMMTGMFARPGDGDELISEIAVSPEGQILINGAPMPF